MTAMAAKQKRPSKAIAAIHADSILLQLSEGKFLKEIAATHGVSKQALQQHLKNDPRYQDALKKQAAALVEEAKELTWAAREPVDIARAREITKFAFRYAESIDTGTWGQRQHVTVEQVGDLGERLRRARERVIEAEPVVDAQQTAIAAPNISPSVQDSETPKDK